MSLTNLDMNWGPLVRTIFVIFILVLKIPVLMFLGLAFSHQKGLNPKMFDSIQYFCACFEAWNFRVQFQNHFIFILSIVSHCYSNRCSLPYNILRRAPMGSIRIPSDGTGSGAPDPRVFIQCVKGREPMDNELWYHGLDCLCRDVHPTARLDIPPGTFR